jgi:tetratricopeptide (TPR) repeat protein
MFKRIVAALVLAVGFSLPVAAQTVDIEALLADLADPETENWQSVERQIRTEWSKSGSAAMDLLLQRGEKALEAEDFDTALDHLTALTDHAPDFAEGWHARATAFFSKEMYGPAMEDLQRTLALNPRHFGALAGVAIVLQRTEHDVEALAAWRLLETIHPHRPELQEAIEALQKQTEGVTL